MIRLLVVLLAVISYASALYCFKSDGTDDFSDMDRGNCSSTVKYCYKMVTDLKNSKFFNYTVVETILQNCITTAKTYLFHILKALLL